MNPCQNGSLQFEDIIFECSKIHPNLFIIVAQSISPPCSTHSPSPPSQSPSPSPYHQLPIPLQTPAHHTRTKRDAFTDVTMSWRQLSCDLKGAQASYYIYAVRGTLDRPIL
ncbi:hypothetical protein EX30DRAFT_265910 [Ascodesmis nigricans]|uniref:Uncharacterized protein n=1 Tax=Ascodesmis nigricans TaxID=341454 RepID=A0A4S2MXU9_9PEZI|nr:hypothetical protein EX30DRAFT_265910 [Ascodesmis nigricans]